MAESDDTPKYEKTYRTILDRLKAGRYPIGMRMPTEGELAAHFSLSRVTIRRALDLLVQDGYVERRRGSGYRVITLSPASNTCLTSFTDAMLRAGHEPTSRLVSLTVFPPDATELAHLPTGMKSAPVTEVARVRLVNGKPQMLVKTYAPSRLLRDALPGDFPEEGVEQSMLRILGSRFRLEWSAACEDISPVVADSTTASTLEIAEGSPLLRQACSAFADDGSVVFYEDVVRTGTVSFNMSRQGRRSRQ